MTNYQRKVYYIEKFIEDTPEGNAGFVSITNTQECCLIKIGIRGLSLEGVHKVSWYGCSQEGKEKIGELPLLNGRADCEMQFAYDEQRYQALANASWLCFEFTPSVWGRCELQKEGAFSYLLQNCPILQPFPDQGYYVSISPLQLKACVPRDQNLANNSFLLHGYYSYQHIILGYYEDATHQGYYLGVPGEYVWKQRQLAQLFGFDGYEKSGELGYYMRKVELGERKHLVSM